MRYVLDFGSANAGTSPTFSVFRNADTLANITPPTITESSNGLFYFDWDWTSTTATSIFYKASVAGVELSDVITSDATNVTASGVASGGAAAMPWLWTAGQIINTAAVECGLSEVVDPYASTDAFFIRLRTLLKTLGHELMGARDWKTLVKEWTVTGDGTTTIFNLPSDFLRPVNDSQFNRSNQWPTGLISSQHWQALKATTLSSTVRTLYRIVQGRIQFYAAPASGAVIAGDYVSRFWAKTEGAATADLYEPADSGDSVMYEPNLMVKGLKLKFLLATNQDATAAAEEYRVAFEAAAGTEPAQILDLNGGLQEDRLIDAYNLPITGWGA